MTIRSRVPDIPEMPADLGRFLDGIDRRQLRLSNVENLADTATLADVIAKINEMLETHRTK